MCILRISTCLCHKKTASLKSPSSVQIALQDDEMMKAVNAALIDRIEEQNRCGFLLVVTMHSR